MNYNNLTFEQEMMLWESFVKAIKIIYPTLFERKSNIQDSGDIEFLSTQIDL
jgi:hypothetical protein